MANISWTLPYRRPTPLYEELWGLYAPDRVILQSGTVNPFDLPISALNPLAGRWQDKHRCFAACYAQPYDNLCYNKCMNPAPSPF